MKSQRGFAQIFVLLLLVVGIALGVYFLKDSNIFKSRANLPAGQAISAPVSFDYNKPTVSQTYVSFPGSNGEVQIKNYGKLESSTVITLEGHVKGLVAGKLYKVLLCLQNQSNCATWGNWGGNPSVVGDSGGWLQADSSGSIIFSSVNTEGFGVVDPYIDQLAYVSVIQKPTFKYEGCHSTLYPCLQTAYPKPVFSPGPTINPGVAQTTFDFGYGVRDFKLGDEVKLEVVARSDVDPANLFSAKLKYNPAILNLSRIETTPSFVKNWAEEYYDNATGEISLVGGVPDPGFKSNVGDRPVMATIYFTAKSIGKTSVEFIADSAIYKNSDNTNILGEKGVATINVGDGSVPSGSPSVCATPPTCPVGQTLVTGIPQNGGCAFYSCNVSATPTPTPTPSSTPILCAQVITYGLNVTTGECKEYPNSCLPAGITKVTACGTGIVGDANGDGKLTLVDLSVLLSKFGKTTNLGGADINKDGTVNSLDFITLKKILTDNKVIRVVVQ